MATLRARAGRSAQNSQTYCEHNSTELQLDSFPCSRIPHARPVEPLVSVPAVALHGVYVLVSDDPAFRLRNFVAVADLRHQFRERAIHLLGISARGRPLRAKRQDLDSDCVVVRPLADVVVYRLGVLAPPRTEVFV